jgi:hypothetical protein
VAKEATPKKSADELTYYRVGGSDDAGRRISGIYFATDEFVIYEAADLTMSTAADMPSQVRFYIAGGNDAGKALRKKIAGLMAIRSAIELLRSHEEISSDEKAWAGRELARAIATAFESEDETPPPAEFLAGTFTRLQSRLKSYFRKKYIASNLAAFAVVTLVLIGLIVIFGNYCQDVELKMHEFKLVWIAEYALYAIFGAIGSLLSVGIGVRNIDPDTDLRKWEHRFTGGARILIGVIGAIIVALAIDANLINPQLSAEATGSPPLPVYLLLSLLAGFSESFAPNLLRRASNKVSPEEPEKKPKVGGQTPT